MFDKNMIRAAALMFATTVGAGIFALPYVFASAGWATAGGYLFILAFAVHYAQSLYLRALDVTAKRHERLVGLVAHYYGSAMRTVSLVVVVGGLLLTLVAYLILAGQFLSLLPPAIAGFGTLLFWLTASLPVLWPLRQLFEAELWGAIVMAALTGGVIVFGYVNGPSGTFPMVVPENFFLPFGAILFALAGWPAVGPVRAFARVKGFSAEEAKRALYLGTTGSAFAYALFVAGIFAGAAFISPDTLTGLSWPLWQTGLLLVLGLFALWTSYAPMGIEIKNSLRDLGWGRLEAAAAVFFLPLALWLLGLQDFLSVIGLVGGVFLGLEYILIFLVVRKALNLDRKERFMLWVLSPLFVVGALYEIWYFIVK